MSILGSFGACFFALAKQRREEDQGYMRGKVAQHFAADFSELPLSLLLPD